MEVELTLKEKSFFYIWILYFIYESLMDVWIDRGSSITIIFNFIIFSYVLYFSFVKNKFQYKFLFIFLYALFFLILIILTSSNLPFSFKNYIKYLEALLCLPLAFNMFDNNTIINKLWWLFKWFVFLFLLNYVLANTLHWGNRYGGEVGAETGNQLENGLYLIACANSITPLFFRRERYKYLIIGSLIISFVISVAILKRAAIAAMILSLMLYYMCNLYFKMRYGSLNINHVSSISKIIRFTLLTIFAIVVTVSFRGVLESQIQTRSNRFVEGALEKEGRVRELRSIFKDIVYSDDISTFLFGRETFNTVGTYGKELHFGQRNIHDDFGIILNGSGVVGFCLYFLINITIVFRLLKYSKNINFSTNETARKMFATYVSFAVIFAIASTSDTIMLVLFPAMYYTVSGMILRYFYEYGYTYKTPNENEDGLCEDDGNYKFFT